MHVIAILTLAALSATAEPAARPKLAVLDVRAVGRFEEKIAAGLSSLVASEAARYPLTVIAGLDVATIASVERQRQLMGADDSAGLTRLGSALGATYLLRTEVAEVDGAFLLSLAVLDVARAKPVSRLTRRLERREQIVDAIPGAVAEVLKTLLPEGAVAAPVVAVPPAASVGLREKAEAPPPERPRPVAGYVLDGAGAAVLAAGLGLGLAARGKYGEAKDNVYNSDPRPYDDARSAAKRYALAADVCYGVGGAALLTGIVLTIVGHASTGAPAPVAFSAGPAGVAVAGSF